ncbi:MAG: (deoxy)nucleoside triphosphate pyrophosphohydrolase [Planctomycetota bacterium]
MTPGPVDPAYVDVTAAVIIRGGRVLLARRKPGKRMEGFWEFPGGRVEPGETLQASMERELREEFGVTARAGAVIAENTHRYDHIAIRLIALAVEITDDPLELHDHDRIEWVPLDRVLDHRLTPADIPIAARLAAGVATTI